MGKVLRGACDTHRLRTRLMQVTGQVPVVMGMVALAESAHGRILHLHRNDITMAGKWKRLEHDCGTTSRAECGHGSSDMARSYAWSNNPRRVKHLVRVTV